MAVKEKAENGILETIKTIVYALLIAGVVSHFVFPALLDSVGINEGNIIDWRFSFCE